MTGSAAYVVDASVGTKLLVAEAESDRAVDLFSDVSLALHVPDLFFIECANVLWKKARRGEYSAEDAVAGLARMRMLGLTVTSTADLVDRAFVIARAHDISAYDACYVALAEILGVGLVTADDRLVAKLHGDTYDIVALGELP